MRIINRPRGAGKTVMLINAAAVTGYPIIVKTEIMKEHVYDVAKIMGVDKLITVFSEREYRDFPFRDDKILVDNIEMYIDDALKQYFGADVASGTCSIEMLGNSKEE